jgi:EpsI family protein
VDVYGPPGARGAVAAIEINRVIIEKGLDRQLVFYWYQSPQRIVASEYWGKIYTVLDAVRYNRTDAAMVRVITPIADDGSSSVVAAEKRARDFVQGIFPQLAPSLPS